MEKHASKTSARHNITFILRSKEAAVAARTMQEGMARGAGAGWGGLAPFGFEQLPQVRYVLPDPRRF